MLIILFYYFLFFYIIYVFIGWQHKLREKGDHPSSIRRNSVKHISGFKRKDT